MAQDTNRILTKMLERLFAAMANGPSLNCKPHSSRQRIDLNQLGKLRDCSADQILKDLLGEQRTAKVIARVPPPSKPQDGAGATTESGGEDENLTPEEKAARAEWSDQQALIRKLRAIAEDSKSYENDTGVSVLQIGFPLLSLPPGSPGLQRGVGRRVLAPLAFIPVALTVRGGASPAVVLECRNRGDDLVVPNVALLAWLEQQTGQAAADLFQDQGGQEPWREIAAIVQRVARLVEYAAPESWASESSEPPPLVAAARSEVEDAKPRILSSAILGLFPVANQGLLRDMQAMAGGESLSGPLESFLRVDATLTAAPTEEVVAPAELQRHRNARIFAEERLVAQADPCQSRAVKLARTCRGLVIHGPPGTGKSQTIANIIGDHLSRGQRVLMVCDKRTALDVVMYRLEALGLGRLCAVVHDPQRDQRELYKGIREQLEGLADEKTYPHAGSQLAKVDAELQALHAELTGYHIALMGGDASSGVSFHELMGQWLQLPSFKVRFKESAMERVGWDELEAHTRPIGELLDRADGAEFATNPWNSASGLPLREFLAIPMDQIRAAVETCEDAARAVDATINPAIPPFDKELDLSTQAAQRTRLAAPLDELINRCEAAILARWTQAEIGAIRQSRQKLLDVAALIDLVKGRQLDTELLLAARSRPPSLATMGEQVAVLAAYSEVAGKWYAFLCLKRKSAAQHVQAHYGVPLTVEAAERVRKFLLGLRARTILNSLHEELLSQPAGGPILTDDALLLSLEQHRLLFDTLLQLHDEPTLSPLKGVVHRLLTEPKAAAAIIDGLRKSAVRAAALEHFEKAAREVGLFNPAWLKSFTGSVRDGKPAGETLADLSDRLGTLEDVLRVRDGVATLSSPLGSAVMQLIKLQVGKEAGLPILQKAVLSLEIARRLKSDPNLQAADGQKLRSSFERYRLLDAQKKTLVRNLTLDTWNSRQRERLLAATGSRLNGRGADLRRRLTIRGERAMRLRQVIASGQDIEDGDPLFDLRPVWMASPETVAQIFPRKPLFDVVIFDEASQCRLEEALPVLTRAERVVVAGDPKQLPPTRFFESAIAVSEDEEIEGEQGLFEAQQGEIEDLLAAALNIEIQESYLDVHYRSRNADLIEFSNQQLYNSRLQSIPGHPSNRSRFAPLTLYRCTGVYEKTCNVTEAEQVCRIVHDLLKRADPPSIGIASFNIQQRDLILEKLDELAAADSDFARRLADARVRRGKGSFDGLFVRNLESVQGDERDHMIISTTYGPDAKGRFYRRFGPLGRAGGGRRLNVLVTRAREEVHLVTSIPESVYRALPPVPAGQAPGGAWLLFSYLNYAERLASEYEMNHRLLSQIEPAADATVNVRPTRWPSIFSQCLAQRLATQHHVGSDVHWGNDGFCVDLALHHPRLADQVTIGVISDLSRFAQADDPVEWEVFRTAILESQGWKLHRLWTPHFYRDRDGCIASILNEAAAHEASEQENGAIRVVKTEQPEM